MQAREGCHSFMQTEKIKSAVCWSLVAVCMGIIFYFSSRTATESSAQSDSILNIIYKLFGENGVTVFIVRKSAHFLEFAGLSFLFSIAFYQQFKTVKFILPVCCTSLYAVTDEVHQLFVEGRACKFFDWVVDTTGGLFGFLLFLISFMIISKIINIKKAKKIDRENF